MTTAQVVETSVTVNNNSPIQDYVHPDDHTQPTYEMTPGFKPFTKNKGLCTHHCFYLRCLPPFITSLLLSYGEGKYMERSNDTSHAKSYVHGNFGFFPPFVRGCTKPYWDLAQTNPYPTSLPFFLIAYYRELRHPEGEFEIFCSFQMASTCLLLKRIEERKEANKTRLLEPKTFAAMQFIQSCISVEEASEVYL